MNLGLQTNEHIIGIFRKHWLTLAAEGFFLVLFAIVPFILAVLVETFLGYDVGKIIGSYGTILTLVWILILWISFFLSWTNYNLDMWVLTNERLIDIEQLGLFSRRVSTLDLARIQDITIETRGLLGTLLRTGTVNVQTAGTERNFTIPNADHPTLIKELISKEVSAQSEQKPVQ